MAWFDGTFDYTDEELNNEFPLSVIESLRMSADGKRVAVINDFERESELFDLSDPHAEESIPGKHTFYHVFLGEESIIIKSLIEDFLSKTSADDPKSVALFRREPNRLFMYSFGYICRRTFKKQEQMLSLIKTTPHDSMAVLVLPLKRYMHKCPVCGRRTLQYRGCYMICTECFWEDEGIDDEDEKSLGANGDYTIRQYREIYLKS